LSRKKTTVTEEPLTKNKPNFEVPSSTESKPKKAEPAAESKSGKEKDSPSGKSK
jgi:hypothetical protein